MGSPLETLGDLCSLCFSEVNCDLPKTCDPGGGKTADRVEDGVVSLFVEVGAEKCPPPGS